MIDPVPVYCDGIEKSLCDYSRYVAALNLVDMS